MSMIRKCTPVQCIIMMTNSTVEPAVIPILLGGGVQMLYPHGVRQYLALVGHRAYPSGMLLLEYEVIQTAEGTNEVAGGKE